MEEPVKKKEQILTVLDSKNTIKEIPFYECQHCMQMIPYVGICQECGTSYDHRETVENFKTGYLHYIYECSGCSEDGRKAQKVIRFAENKEKSRSEMRKELAHEFLKSGGY